MKDGENMLLNDMLADCIDVERLLILAHGIKSDSGFFDDDGPVRYVPVNISYDGVVMEVQVCISRSENNESVG